MKIKSGIGLLLMLNFFISRSQELFPHTEPASNVPKGVLGIRISSEAFKGTYTRTWEALRLYYGLGPKWTVIATGSTSNHHDKILPKTYFSDDGNGIIHSHNFIKSNYPYLFDGVHLYSKYRFLTADGNEKHLRMAFYNEIAFRHIAHDEAEPSLLEDNAGFGSGLIITSLYKKLAVSLTTGFIIPYRYKEGPDHQFTSGNGINYSLSIGYKTLPLTYKGYKQTNLNLYVEIMGKWYDKATLMKADKRVDITGVYALQAGNSIDVRPSVQLIFNSNLRIDLSGSLLVSGTSYTKIYPAYYLNLQRYFYFK